MSRIAVFAGSFDPFTLGHQDIARRGLELFDHLVIAIGLNAQKRPFFSTEIRLAMIRASFPDECRITVTSFAGLTIDLCRQHGAHFLLRGLRSATDFDYERTIAQANQMIAHDIETLFLLSRPEHAAITSTVVRDLLAHGHDVRGFLPAEVDITRYLSAQ